MNPELKKFLKKSPKTVKTLAAKVRNSQVDDRLLGRIFGADHFFHSKSTSIDPLPLSKSDNSDPSYLYLAQHTTEENNIVTRNKGVSVVNGPMQTIRG